MTQPNDLGEIWSLIQRSPSFKPGEYCYVAIYDPLLKTLSPGLFEVQEVFTIDMVLQQIGGPRGLVVEDHQVKLPIWGTLGKIRVQ